MLGTWRSLTLSTPLTMLAGDVPRLEGDKLRVYRNGVLVAERTLTFPGNEYDPPPLAATKTISTVYYFQETRMPGVMATMTGAHFNESNGQISFTYSDGSGMVYADTAAVEAECGYDVDADFPKRVLAMRAIRKSNGLANLSNMVGATCAVDMNADTPIAVVDPVQ